ncbi:hypothetical protein WICPIJ_003768 [Wickerhamomyces pijperi]|uniref:Type 2A phosphatase activator TIP41 n=1 Tax=Wickerhamomyces pijperi TaxID=599730 RepID=A0A9P8TNL0_WICPI|nr:hypothetical protein WICPIJ_003768 [Wickerhamomyces pijperi]
MSQSKPTPLSQTSPGSSSSSFLIPSQPSTQTQGINTVHINAARELHAQTVRARGPPLAHSKMGGSPQMKQQQQTKRPTVNSASSSSSISSSISTSSSFPSTVSPQSQPYQREIDIQVPAKSHTESRCTNPQCSHCGTVIIPSPVANYPLSETPSISVNDWEIYTVKNPILSGDLIDKYTEELALPIPEMIFGTNKVEIRNDSKKFGIQFNAIDALRLVKSKRDKIDIEKDLIKVSYSNEWFQTRKERTDEVKELPKPFDWTYSMDYKGTLIGGQQSQLQFTATTDPAHRIPVAKLQTQDPILFFDDMILYEDELADNGISLLSVKIRVMPQRLLLLSRFFLRVDNVLLRVRDTRVYVDFEEDVVIREYKEQEDSYDNVLRKVRGGAGSAGDPRAKLRDQAWVSSVLPVLKEKVEFMNL